MFYHTFISVYCNIVVTCWERADLLAFLYVMFSSVFVTFTLSVLLGQVCSSIVLISGLCFLPYVVRKFMKKK